jgi:ribosomal protein S2
MISSYHPDNLVLIFRHCYQQKTLIDASNEVGLEVNTEKTKYMLLSRHKNAGQSYDIKIANKCFENVAKFRYLGTTITNQNLIKEKLRGD